MTRRWAQPGDFDSIEVEQGCGNGEGGWGHSQIMSWHVNYI